MALTPENIVIQSFWDGPITTMERLSAASFLKNGHQFNLYSYQNGIALGGLPKGTTVLDADQILPRSMMDKFPTKQQFADYFRVVLLNKYGGWWVDCDQICLMPFDFQQPYVFVDSSHSSVLMTSPMKAPQYAPIMQEWQGRIEEKIPDIDKLGFQDLGPLLLPELVEKFELKRWVRSHHTFAPIDWTEASKIVDPGYERKLNVAYAVHLYHAMWNNGPQSTQPEHSFSPNTEGHYHSRSIYEILKRRYL
jgi:hypothetical protein